MFCGPYAEVHDMLMFFVFISIVIASISPSASLNNTGLSSFLAATATPPPPLSNLTLSKVMKPLIFNLSDCSHLVSCTKKTEA